MSDNWKDVKNTQKKYKNIKEELYILSDILFNGGCMRCMNKSCTINEDHGIYFPEKISTFVQNPTYINGIEKSIQNAKLDFNGKKPFFTTCNYANKKCRNCEEGRIKYINFNNEKIALCYPSLEAIRFKVTVGLHIDIKLILKGTKYEVSAIPINIIIENKKIENLPVEKKELSSEENWPILCNNTSKSQIKNVLDYSQIEKSIDLSTKQIEEEKLDTIKVVISRIKEEKSINLVDNSILIEKDKKIKDLSYENNYLKNEVKKLYDQNILLEEKNKREMFIINNKHKYDEILENVKYLNTRITQQFFETNYDQYVLI
jgi:cell division protein FtsB